MFLSIARLGPSTRAFKLRADLLRRAGLGVDGTARVTSSARFIGPDVRIGSASYIGHEVLVIGTEGSHVHFGERVDVGPRCMFVTGSHHIGDRYRRAGEGYGRDIVIGDATWVGASCLVLGGAEVGAGCVIAAGSVLIARKYPANSLLAGAPADVVRDLDA